MAALMVKEGRCPACAKARRLAEGTNLQRICEDHFRLRSELVFN